MWTEHRLQFDVMFATKMLAKGLLVVCFMVSDLCIRMGATSDRVFDAQPKIITQDGHLIFMTADNHNITFKSLGQGSIRIDEDDLKAVVTSAKRSITEMEKIKNDDIAVMQQTIQRLQVRLDGLHSMETRLTNTEQTVRSLQEQLISGANGTRLADLANSQVQLSQKLQRLRNEFKQVKQLLEKNECASSPCRNGGTCVDSYNGFTCKCPIYWEGTMCDTDVNECREFIGTGSGCQNGATCVNSQGSYSCQCTADWHGVHCAERHDDCTSASAVELCSHGTCVNQPRRFPGLPKFYCICEQGWMTDGHNPACNVDVDECQTGRHSCSQNPRVQCRNIPGGFMCGECPSGYSGNGFTCEDINECLMYNGGCSMSPMVHCTNMPGSRHCGACPLGYRGDGVICTFSGLCSANNGGCHPLATCVENSAVSSTYRECRCPPGYLGSGFGLNGCVSHSGGGTTMITPIPLHPCDSNPCLRGTCVASGPYSFRCNCPLGYEGQRCELSRNDCDSAPCFNGATCVDQPTGYACHCSPHHTGTNCEQDIDACGDYLTDVNGTIRYPSNSSLVYQDDKACTWVIITTPGMVLNLTFPEFHLEPSYNCEYDFLQLNDGRSVDSHKIGRFCGLSPPNGGNVITTDNAVYVWFRSDSSISKDGFRINWETIAHVCGGDLPESSYGVLLSPGYPTQYPRNRDCVWIIRVPLGKRISISFAALELEHHDTCNFDFLEIRDGIREADQVLGTYCGTGTNRLPPPPIETVGSFARVYFHSDSSNTASGFHLTYSSIPGVLGCGGLLNAESGVFSTPDHPNSYARGLECDWEIRVPLNERIRLTFTLFDVERHERCPFDYVAIYDGRDETAPLIGRYCGGNLPPVHMSLGNSLFVKFISDHSIEHLGFRATYIVVCGGTFTEPHGIIHSPYYPESYPASRECIYVIRQPPGKAIELRFVAFDVESAYNCRYDYFLVRDGDSETSPVVNKFCGTVIPGTIISTHNALWMQFETDSSNENRGFLANYTTIDVACGGILTDESGVITSPSHPEQYLSSADCHWIIRPKSGYVVRLTFTSFSVEYHADCRYDYVAIYDNTTTEEPSKLMRRYCGNTLPPTLTSLDNLMLVVFHSDVSVSYDGFSIHYLAFDASSLCGGEYYSTIGVIRSPNFPRNYQEGRRCTWKIEVPTGQQIMLNFSHFDLESHNDCNYDYLEIRNGVYATSPLIGKYCGRTVSKNIYSHGNQLMLKFASDSSQSASGFEVTWDGTTTGCGGALTSSQGSIASPNYPGSCNAAMDCTWSITVARGNRVKINFSDLSLPLSDDCASLSVEIYNGKSFRSPLLRRICGSSIPDSFTSEKHEVFVRYRCSEGSMSDHRGFVLTYETECNVRLSGRRGVIETPNYPNPYPHERNCTWKIRGPTRNSLNMSFSMLQLESASNCALDFITIYDKINRSTLGPYCSGSQVPRSLSLTSNVATINFVSDSSVADNGFALEWVASGCGQDFRKPFGSFSTPNYPMVFPSEITCDWQIFADPGSNIELTIHDYDVDGSRSCILNSLAVYGGVGINDPQIIRLCSSQTAPVTVRSSGNHMYIRFQSDILNTYKGFNASYVVKTNGCGGVFTASSGAIHSRNYPEHYGVREDCSWLVTVSKGHSVRLRFTEFEVLPMSDANCSTVYVAIYDGPDELSPLLARLCGSNVPSDAAWNSTDNRMFIKMNGDESITAKGFEAKYEAGCGAILYADELGAFGISTVDDFGFINRPSIIRRRDSMCTWVIKARNLEDKVTLMFTSLSVLLTPTNCTQRPLLEVYDGELSDSPLLSYVCTEHVPPAVTSLGSAIRVVSYHGRGRNLLFRATYYEASAACGGVFDSLSGSFISPDYPNYYPAESECVWTIKTSPGHRTMLSFSAFDLEESDYCNLDYVEVRENDDSGRLIGRYCGQTLPGNLTAAHQLWVKFRSDRQNGRSGFAASYSLLYHSYLTGTSGEIASPLYPRMFYGTQIFEWVITVPLEMHVQVTFIELRLCPLIRLTRCETSLMFYDGADNTGDHLASYCGGEQRNPVVSNGNQMFVKFKSRLGFFVCGSSFLLQWNATFYGPIAPTALPPSINGSSDCNLVLNVDHHEELELSSPGFPNGYANNKRCEWVVLTPIGTRAKFSFSTLDLEGYYYCDADHVEFYGGTVGASLWQSLGRFCRRAQSNTAILSGTNSLKVIFTSDNWSNRTGFMGHVSAVCGGNVTAASGSIQSPNYPRDYDYNGDCEWVISVRPGRTIQLRFVDFQLEGDTPQCQNDYLLIKNGFNSESPILGAGKFCGSSLPLNIPETTTNHLYIRFVSNQSYQYKGFKLMYTEISLECGGSRVLNEEAPTEILQTPNFPSPYPPQTECEWVIVAPPLSRVRLDFEDHFDIPTFDCANDYLEIYDGGTALAPFLGRFCGHTLPTTVQATGNSLFARFSSVDKHPSTGFRATAKIAMCGGTIAASTGSITSPNYRNGYVSGLDCEWTVHGLPGHYFVFTLVDIQTTAEEASQRFDCSKSDTVVVRDYNSTGMLLGEFCGEGVYQSFSSAGDVAYVRFTSKENSPAMRGFRLIFNMSTEGCGEELTTPSGIITSPNYPGIYPNHRLCEWEIRAPPDRRVRLTFTNLDLQRGEDGRCLDWVSAYNYAKSKWDYTVLHPFFVCQADDEMPVIISGSNYMKVKFSSDGESSGTGFRAVYDTELERECGGDLPLPSGNIVSPGFELGNYTHNLYCVWNLVGDRPNSTFKVQLHQMVLEAHSFTTDREPVCAYDRLDIFEVSRVDAGVAFTSLCGNHSEPKTFAVPYSSVVFLFKTDPSVIYDGFNLSYSVNDCGGELTEAGVVTSPGYPTTYGNNHHCAWVVQFEEGQQVQITFEDFYLENSDGCTADKLIVHNGMSTFSPVIGTYCGDKTPADIRSQRHVVLIEFKTNGVTSLPGFSLRVTPVSAGCGGTFHSSNGVISSVGYPHAYPANVECEWFLEGNSGFYFKVTFIGRFDLEMSATCDMDYIEGFEYVDDLWLSLGRQCGSGLISPYLTRSPRFRLLFRSNEAINGDGFKAMWNETCGGVFKDKSGTFSSPDYPEVYPNGLNCIYVISPDPSHYVVLTFDNDFGLEVASNCMYDVLEIYAGSNTNGELLHNVCETPPPMVSAQGAITVRLKTDFSNQGKGFQAHYEISECGGFLNHAEDPAAAGIIASPLHPVRYHQNMNCTWVIEVVPNRVIIFKFQVMDVEATLGCMYDYVKLFDGNSTLSPLLGDFCGRSIPSPIISTGNMLTVQFKTDEIIEMGGFRGVYRATFGVSQGCGGVLEQSHGTIQSLDIDNDGKYEDGLDCAWLIIGAPFKVLQLTFLSFDIEKPANHDGCPRDYLQIRDGPSPESVLIETLCGSETPHRIVSSTNQMWLMFLSDQADNRAGFRATYESIEPECGGYFNVTNDTNVFESPGFPENYPLNVRCRWSFFTSSDESPTVEFYYNEFQLEDSSRCSKDYLTLFSFDPVQRRPMYRATHCGHAKPPDLFLNARAGVHADFVSDSTTTGKGFKIHYRLAGCDRLYEEPFGIIYRVRHNMNHRDHLDCHINISVPANRTITISFSKFQLDYYYRSARNGNCDAYLEIRDGPTDAAPLIVKICETYEIPNPVFSTGNQMLLRLYAESPRYHNYDLELQYYSSDQGRGCGGELTSAFGSFSSPLYPSNYSLDAVCRWKVSVPHDRHLTVRVVTFDIQSSENCTGSWLEFYAGAVESETHLVNTFCGTDRPGVVTIASNVFITKYVTSPQNTGTGFRITYNTFDALDTSDNYNNYDTFRKYF